MFINNQEFMVELFDDVELAKRAGEIGTALLEGHSLRMTDIAVEMEGESAAGYKRIQRFLGKADPRTALWRLFQEDAAFVIGDLTEIERPHAWKTEYVGWVDVRWCWIENSASWNSCSIYSKSKSTG